MLKIRFHFFFLSNNILEVWKSKRSWYGQGIENEKYLREFSQRDEILLLDIRDLMAQDLEKKRRENLVRWRIRWLSIWILRKGAIRFLYKLKNKLSKTHYSFHWI